MKIRLLQHLSKSWSFDWTIGVFGGAFVMSVGSWRDVAIVLAIGVGIRVIALLALSLSNGGQAVPVQLVRKTRRGK